MIEKNQNDQNDGVGCHHRHVQVVCGLQHPLFPVAGISFIEHMHALALPVQVSAFQQAAFCYEELLVHEPAKLQYHLLYADCQYSMHNWRTACTYYSSALQLTGGVHPRALYGITACAAQLAGQKVQTAELVPNSIIVIHGLDMLTSTLLAVCVLMVPVCRA